MKGFLIAAALIIIGFVTKAQTFTLRSSDLGGQATQKQVLKGFGCNGSNLSPHLSWEHAPEGTKSFAVTIFDESAPTASGWWHWLIFDIPFNTTELKPGAGDINSKIAPERSIQSITDFKGRGYSGPCPPQGSKPHRYIVTVYALNVERLGLDGNANPALVSFALEQNLIEKASIVFYYKR